MKRNVHKGASLLLAVIFVIISCLPAVSVFAEEPAPAAAESAEPSGGGSSRFKIIKDSPKIINIVYDDSGSMVNPEKGDPKSGFTPNWCQAKYALEAFISIMNPEDTLNIYAMSGAGKRYKGTIHGNDKVSAVKGIHENFKTGDSSLGTPIATLDGAARDLKTAKGKGCDKWLIVITDGAFTTDITGSKEIDDGKVKAKLSGYAGSLKKDGEKRTIYMPVGSAAKKFTGDNYHTLVSKNGGELIQNLQKASELIYNRVSMDKSGNTFRIGVSTNRIIIFAQNKDIAAEPVIVKGGTQKVKVDVKYTEAANSVDYSKKGSDNGGTFKGKEGDIKDDKSLQGFVATIEPTEDAIRPGDVTVKFTSGAPKSYKVYYEPAVVAYYSLTGTRKDGSVIPVLSSEKQLKVGSISPGEYTLKCYIGDALETQKDELLGEEVPKDVSGESDIAETSFDVELNGPAVGGKTKYSLSDLQQGVTLNLGKGKMSCDKAVSKILGKYRLDASGLVNSFKNVIVKSTYRLKVDYVYPKETTLNYRFKKVEYLLPSLKRNTKDKKKIKALVSCVDDEGKPYEIKPEVWEKLDLNNVQLDSGKTNIGQYSIEKGGVEKGKGVLLLTPSYAVDRKGRLSPKKTTHTNFIHKKRRCTLRPDIFIDVDKELAMSTTMSADSEISGNYEISISMWYTILTLFVIFWILGYFFKRKLPKQKVGNCTNTVAKKLSYDPITFEQVWVKDKKVSDSSRILKVTKPTRLLPYVTQRGRLDLGGGIPTIDFKAASKRGKVYITNSPSDFEGLSKSAKVGKNTRYVQIGEHILTPDYVKEKQKSKAGYMFTLPAAVIEFGASEGSQKFKKFDLSFNKNRGSDSSKKKKKKKRY